MKKTIDNILSKNPNMTYGQAVGYMIGLTAKALGDKTAGLSTKEWNEATDDYAHGYRLAFKPERK